MITEADLELNGYSHEIHNGIRWWYRHPQRMGIDYQYGCPCCGSPRVGKYVIGWPEIYTYERYYCGVIDARGCKLISVSQPTYECIVSHITGGSLYEDDTI